MLLLKLIFLTVGMNKVISFTTLDFSDEVTGRILNSLFRNYTTICYVSSRSAGGIPSTFLGQVHKPLLMFTYDMFIKKRELERCDGYIVNLRDLRPLKRITEKTQLFKPHTRLVIFYVTNPEIRFPELSLRSGVDVNEFQLSTVKTVPVSFKLTSLLTEKVIFRWQVNQTDYLIDKEKFSRIKWDPVEFFRRSTYVFRFAVFNCLPFVKYLDGNVSSLEGTEIRLALEMTRGFRVKYVRIHEDHENPWDEVLRMVETRRADMAGCSQYIGNLRNHNLDFSINQNQVCSTFLVPKAQLYPAASFFSHPFTHEVWITLTLITSFLIVLLNLIVHIKGFLTYHKAYRYNKIEPGLITINMFRMFTAGSIYFNKGLTMVLGVKLYILIISIGGLLITTYYCAGLSSILFIPKLTRQITTFQDMVTYKITYQGMMETWLMYSDSLADLRSLHRNEDRLRTKLGPNTAIAVKTLENSYVTDLDGFDVEGLKSYRVLKECGSNFYTGFALQKDSPFAERFNEIASRMMESGINKHWIDNEIDYNRKLHDSFFRSYNAIPGYNAVDIHKLRGVFMLWGFGLGVAAMVLLLELIVKFIKRGKS